jgi:hypothetical protein
LKNFILDEAFITAEKMVIEFDPAGGTDITFTMVTPVTGILFRMVFTGFCRHSNLNFKKSLP